MPVSHKSTWHRLSISEVYRSVVPDHDPSQRIADNAVAARTGRHEPKQYQGTAQFARAVRAGSPHASHRTICLYTVCLLSRSQWFMP